MPQWKGAAICLVAAVLFSSQSQVLSDNEKASQEQVQSVTGTKAEHGESAKSENGKLKSEEAKSKSEEKKELDAAIESIAKNSPSLTAMILTLLIPFMILLGLIAWLLGARKYIDAKAEKLRTDDYERILSFLPEGKREQLAEEWLLNWNAKQGKNTSIRKLDELQNALNGLIELVKDQFTSITGSVGTLSRKFEDAIKSISEQLKKMLDSHIAMKLDAQLKANIDHLKELETNAQKVSLRLDELIKIQKEIEKNTQPKK